MYFNRYLLQNPLSSHNNALEIPTIILRSSGFPILFVSNNDAPKCWVILSLVTIGDPKE